MKGRVALIIAFLLAVISVIVVRMYLKQTEEDIRQKARPVTVLCAKRAMQAGTVITNEDIDKTEIPTTIFASGDYYEIDQKDALKGMKLPYGMKKEEPFTRKMWAVDGEDGLKPLVDDDRYRAITIGVDKVSGVGNLIKDGSEVDIYCSYNMEAGAAGGQSIMRTIPVLSNVYVIRTDKQSPAKGKSSSRNSMFSKGGSSGGSEAYSTVTVKIKPEEIPVLTLAQKKGELTLVLRKKSSVDLNVGKMVDDTTFESDAREILRARGSNPK